MSVLRPPGEPYDLETRPLNLFVEENFVSGLEQAIAQLNVLKCAIVFVKSADSLEDLFFGGGYSILVH